MSEKISPITEQVAKAMKRRRLALGYKQADAAAKTGINLNTLRKFEQTGRMSLERFLKLCMMYQMDDQVMNAIESQDSRTSETKRVDAKKVAR